MPVTSDLSVFDKLKTLGPAGARGLSVAVKRTTRKGRGIIVEEAARAYKVDAKTMGKAIRIPRNTAQALTGEIKVKGNRLPMIAFSPQPNMPFLGGRRPAGVSVDIKTRRMVLQSKAHPGEYAFIARMASGHVGLFQRTGRFGRMPKKGLIRQTGTCFSIKAGKTAQLERIEEMYTLAPAQMMSASVYPKVQARLSQQLAIEAEKEYGRAVRAMFKQWAGK